jgi:hypothetical protein
VFRLVLTLVLALSAGVPAAAESSSPEQSQFPSLISAVRVRPPLEFCGEAVPLDESEVRERLEKELLLNLWDRAQVILYLKRMGRYFPHIEKVLERNGLPEDLKYVAVAESALLPHIGSSAGAVGYWQFIPSTGRRYGLQIDREKDERRNLFSATRAATAYFAKLYSDFGSWTLAAAAYNMGEAGLSRRIRAQGTRNYYHLYLPLETQRYIFRILAVKLILENPARFGFHLDAEDYWAPMRFDRVEVSLGEETPLKLIADAAGTYFKKIKDLNPEIRGSDLPRGNHSLLIPEGTAAGFQARIKPILQQYRAEQARPQSRGQRVHVVRPGEYLSAIAERYRVPLSSLMRWNGLNSRSTIHPGQRLVIRD